MRSLLFSLQGFNIANHEIKVVVVEIENHTLPTVLNANNNVLVLTPS